MKFQTSLFLALLVTSCSKQKHTIEGTWTVNNNFYKATYKILKQQNKLIGKVLYYNDGTTILRETGTFKDIFLFNLKQQGNEYVDAISGATNNGDYATKVVIRNKDTLAVTSYIMKKPITEYWIRHTKNNH